MTVVRKQFDRALYEAYDTPARDALVGYLELKGHIIVNNEENFNVDVVSQKGGYTYFNEVEVKTPVIVTGKQSITSRCIVGYV